MKHLYLSLCVSLQLAAPIDVSIASAVGQQPPRTNRGHESVLSSLVRSIVAVYVDA